MTPTYKPGDILKSKVQPEGHWMVMRIYNEPLGNAPCYTLISLGEEYVSLTNHFARNIDSYFKLVG